MSTGGLAAWVSATRYSYATAATNYTYDGDNLRVTQTTAGGTVNYTWDTSQPVPQILADGTADYIYGPDGAPTEQIDLGGTPSYYFRDAVGSTRALLTTTGTVGATFAYTPYGALGASTGTLRTPLLFAHGYQDTDTGLLYLINRYYDPITGQFVTVDPAVDQTGSSYGYAAGNPVSNTDPRGLSVNILLKTSQQLNTGLDIRSFGNNECFTKFTSDCLHTLAGLAGDAAGSLVIGVADIVTTGIGLTYGRVSDAEVAKSQAYYDALDQEILRERRMGSGSGTGQVCQGSVAQGGLIQGGGALPYGATISGVSLPNNPRLVH